MTLNLVKNYNLSLIKAISLITKNPSEILGLETGTISPDSEADLIIFDLEKPWKINSGSFHSKSKNSPFIDAQLSGKVIHTISKGVITTN